MDITLYSLTDYNAGKLVSETFDLDLIDSKDEYLEAIAEWLEGIGEPREEWIVCDYEGIPSELVGEYDLDNSFWDFKECIDATHLDAEVVEAWIALGNEPNATKLEDHYAGYAETDLKFFEDYLDSTGEEPPTGLFRIDWEGSASDFASGYIEHNGHYFY